MHMKNLGLLPFVNIRGGKGHQDGFWVIEKYNLNWSVYGELGDLII